MRKSLFKLLGAVAALTLSTCVSAIGMGGINVVSALGQPLNAEIELVSVKKTEKSSLVARLASPDIYKGAGLEYPYGNKFKFQIESRADGQPYIKVGSAQPVNDPFVNILVELSWASGKLLREYTFLLDPPGYVAVQPEPGQVQAVAPAVRSETAEIPAGSDAQAAADEVQPAADAAAPAGPVAGKASTPAGKASTPAGKASTPAGKSVDAGEITVVRGDTLGRIARQYKPTEVSLERMLVALYRANASQFDGKNMNRIRAGKILRLPSRNELMEVAQTDAVKEIRAQTADWNAYRQKLAAAAPAAATQPKDAGQVATGKITSSIADKAPVAKESAKEVLKLSKGEAPGDRADAGGTGKPMTAQDKKIAEQEEATARSKAIEEERARTALLEKNLKDMERLAQLKSEVAALAQSSVAASGVVAAESAVAAASEVKPEPAVKPRPKPKAKPPVAPQPSLMDQILGEPLYLAGGALILIGLGGLGFLMHRRKQGISGFSFGKGKKKPEEESGEEAGAVTTRITAPVEPSPDTGDFTSATGKHQAVAAQADDEADPIKEADLFLNFGRDAQAEEILKEALRNTPDNHQIHLKLLGIYANRKDVNSFSSIARQLKDSGDEEAWQQAAAMGRALEPGNPMYGGTGSLESTGSATMQTTVLGAMPDFGAEDKAAPPDVDFDLGGNVDLALGGAEQTAPLSADDSAMAQAGAMDFDVTSAKVGAEAHGAMDFDLSTTVSPVPAEMDFDVTSTGRKPVVDFDATTVSPSAAAAEKAESTLPNLDDLVFDITSSSPTPPEAEPEKAAQPDDGGMEFTLDFPIEEPAQKPVPAASPAGTDFTDISLNLDDIGTAGELAAETKDEHWHEVATKLDLAKAYQEMGDLSGAREILDEVMREGDTGQREAAQSMLDQLG